MNKINESKKKSFVDEINFCELTKKKVSSLIIQILDKNDEHSKISLYSKTFSLFLENIISYDEFVIAFKKISQASTISLDFLTHFTNLKELNAADYSSLALEQNVQEGLIYQAIMGGLDASGNISPEDYITSHKLTETGALILKIINYE